MIEIKNLTKAFGKKKVINNLSLTVKKGERISIIAPSGSGKTTLFRIISGIDKKYDGYCKCDGRVSYMFQEDRLFEFSTVLENLTAVTDDEEKALSTLVALELPDSADSYPSDLSGGMKRRVALARALLAESDVILLDEPFVGLDEELKKRIAPAVSELIGEKTLLVVTHYKDEAEMLLCKNACSL